MANKQLDILINIIKRIAGLDETKKGVKDLGEETEKTGKKGKSAWKQFGEDIDKVHTGLGKLKSGLSSMIGLVTKMATGIAGAAASVGALAVNSANFNITVARAATMTDKLGFVELRNEALRLSQEVGIAKTEISQGLYQALSASIPAENVFSFVSTAAKIAVTDGSDVATVVDGLSTVLNAFKISADQTEAVADAMFKTVANGKTTFSDLASNMATAAPTAAALGVSYEQVLAAVATLTKQGVPTAQALNQIRNMMLQLNTELGEGWSKTRTLQEALVEVAAKGGNSALALEQAFGKENVSGVLGLIGDNAKTAKSDLEALAGAAGTLEQKYAQVDQYKHWDKAWEAAKNVLQQVGNVLDTTIAPTVQRVTEGIKAWSADTAFWDALAAKMVSIREQVESIIAAAQADKLNLSAVGELLTTYAKIAAGEAVNVLITALAGIGKMLGEAFINYVKENIVTISQFAANPIGYQVQNGLNFVKNQVTSRFGGGDEEDAGGMLNVIDTSAWQKQAEEIKAALVAQGDAIRTGSEQIAAAATSTSTSVQAAGTAVEEAMQTGEQVADAMDQYAVIVEDGNGNITQALDQAGNDVTAQAQATKEAIDAAAQQAATDMQTGADTVTAAASAATGQIGGSITGLGTAVTQMATNTQQGLDQVARNMSATYTALNSTLQSIIAQLESTRSLASAAGRNADTALSQIKNMR